MSALPLEYNCAEFMSYVSSTTDYIFLQNIIDWIPKTESGNTKAIIKMMIGITGDVDVLNLQEIYYSWANGSSVSKYIGMIGPYFIQKNNVGLTDALAAWEEFSSFLLNAYFCIVKPGTDKIPKIVNPSSESFSVQTDNFVEFFKDEAARGIGNTFIKSYCAKLLDDIENKNIFVSRNPRLMEWCGCFADVNEFIVGKDDDFPPECSPICINSTAVKIVNDFGHVKQCNSAICIISDISIKTVDTPNGFINFKQICTACSTPSDDPGRPQVCKCIIDSSVLALIGKVAAGDEGNEKGMDSPVVFDQFCPGGICLLVNEIEGTVLPIECNQFNIAASGADLVDSSGSEKDNRTASISDSASILFIIISCFLILLCVSIFSFGKKILIKKSSF